MQGMTKRSGASFSLLVFRPSVEKYKYKIEAFYLVFVANINLLQ